MAAHALCSESCRAVFISSSSRSAPVLKIGYGIKDLKSTFLGKNLRSGGIAKVNSSKLNCNSLGVFAAATIESSSLPLIYKGEYTLSDGSQLLISSNGASNKEKGFVELRIRNGALANSQLIAHWGAIKTGLKGWSLPGFRPTGTKLYKNRALQSPFVKEGDSVVLRIEIAEPKYEAIEFTLKDEATGNWYKNEDGNFRVQIPESTAAVDIDQIVVPLEIVQVQAYLNWEKNGRQNYSPEKEKEEFAKTLRSLQEQIASGETTVEKLEKKLLGKSSPQLAAEESQAVTQKAPEQVWAEPEAKDALPDIPEDLLAIKAFINWERNGKPNYSQEEQDREYQKGRLELQMEVLKGVSLEALRQRLVEGDSPGVKQGKPSATVAAPRKEKKGSITRKDRDLAQLINRFDLKGQVAVPDSAEATRALPVSDLDRVSLEYKPESGTILSKKKHRIGNGKGVLIALSWSGEDSTLLLVSDYTETLTIQWGLCEKKGSAWQSVQKTEFLPGYSGLASLQYLEAKIKQSSSFGGISFVLNSGDSWFKDSGSDFFLSLKPGPASAAPLVAGSGEGTAKEILDEITDSESEAEKSLMHRFNIGAGIVEKAISRGELGLAAVLVWFRFSATRQLTWNRNYNVKPREISTAQDRMTDRLEDIFKQYPQYRETVRMIMLTVGRGGQGDVGQRIRDEILVIQRHNDCKGGMMEEWHQKLHNNTSPDDVVICQALLAYLDSNFDLDVYWATLNAEGVTRERLASYDRKITSEPRFTASQKEGLTRDLTNYLKSLKAVHSGADLESAIASCLGYTKGAHDFMKTVEIHAIQGLSSDLPHLLKFVLDRVEDRNIVPLIEALVEARLELRPSILQSSNRTKDLIFLDLSLDGAVRTAVERGLEKMSQLSPEDLMYIVSLIVENIVLSVDNNEELVYCLKDWRAVIGCCRRRDADWALRAKAVMDRTRLFLQEKAENVSLLLQPSADYLGARLNIDSWAVAVFSEEMVRSGSSASLSQVLNKLDPILRAAADMGSWQVISPIAAKGYVESIAELAGVQDDVYTRPTVLIATRVSGEEEIPEGVVALLTADMPDVLSHVSVRTRNSKVCFATCFDSAILSELRSLSGQVVSLEPTKTADLSFSVIPEADLTASQAGAADSGVPEGLSLKIAKKTFLGKFAIAADDFTPDFVGAKSRNIAGLRGKLPDWILLPTSIAIPFGSFEKALEDPSNTGVAAEIQSLVAALKESHTKHTAALQLVRETVLKLSPPPVLVAQLQSVMKASNMPWPGDQGDQRWDQAWTAIKRVWASKWNERAYLSMRKVGLNHADLSMAVLVQEIIQADYAFVIHTTNPSTGDSSQIYAEVVKGLGETLVGAYPGRALSFSAQKDNIDSPKVVGYPSKRVGLFIAQSIIFRSDSNGEDLEGYAGAGLYDSVPIDLEEELPVDYSSDALLVDGNFQRDILSKIAKAGLAIEQALKSPQDIEGVVKDGKIYVVQTRPQM